LELKLKRPVVFLDIETTGINVASDRVVEISLLKISPDGTEQWMTSRVNPGMPIPAKATAIHGISDADVADAPAFREIAKRLASFLDGCDIAGYNSMKFDIPVIAEEFLRCDTEFNFRKRKYIDVQVIFHRKEQRTLAAAYQFYCNKELVNAHDSRVDTGATYEVLKAQLDRYSDLENDIDKLADFCDVTSNVDFAGRIILDENGVEIFNFGKHKGKSVETILKEEPSYYSWMMNGDFPLYTKKVLTEIKLRAFGDR
jgi:DNA polymerase-3 subunit epsilon